MVSELVTLDEMKQYLRVDFDDDDLLLTSFIAGAEELCMDIARCDDMESFAEIKNARIAIMFAVAYLYEHREDADYRQLALSLRSLLFGFRKEVF